MRSRSGPAVGYKEAPPVTLCRLGDVCSSDSSLPLPAPPELISDPHHQHQPGTMPGTCGLAPACILSSLHTIRAPTIISHNPHSSQGASDCISAPRTLLAQVRPGERLGAIIIRTRDALRGWEIQSQMQIRACFCPSSSSYLLLQGLPHQPPPPPLPPLPRRSR